MSQKTREKYGIRLPVVDSVSRGTGLTAAARGEFVREVEAPAPAAPPPGAVWNNIRRLWMVDGVACDPQPPAPVGAGGGLTSANPFSGHAVMVQPSPRPADVPPAVKVTA